MRSILHIALVSLWIVDVYSIATLANSRRALADCYREGYIGEFEEVDDHRNGKIVVQLNGRLNKTGVISPRYNVALRDLEKWVVKLLPSRQFGYIILTTSSGIMDHEEARRKHVSGKIIGFFY
jgi:small subunit ribosomal protein S15Ae